MLMFVGNGKVTEDHEEDEKIVDTQGEFDHVAGDEFQRGLLSLPEVDDGGEDGSEGDPDRAPDQGFTEAHDTTGSMEDPQVQREHSDREEVEQYPEIEHDVSGLGGIKNY